MSGANGKTGQGGKAGRGREKALVRALVQEEGRTYAEEAGVRLKDAPQPLYQLMVLSHLLSARIRADVAVAAARALFEDGMRTPRRMADASWQERVDALGKGHYRRYDERTATQLGDGAGLVLEKYRGDLRRMREEARRRADGDGADETAAERELLQEAPGIGPAGADIFLREVQGVWPEVRPHIDGKALDGAARLGLPDSPGALARLVGEEDLPRLAAGLVRVALDKGAAERVREAAGV
ncbi:MULTISPECIES: endonuclease [Streptomyces]|uniref:endonuclease n=1 Tax=Streptomyces TaxID=1883 RepID=UPI001D152497|nr:MULTISPECIES: endonuclease [Streptomyces]MCC3654247.1 endonuclease [Streptomyces sp. S07_1.15]WSQ71333.1 endonuclease [Streptomyces xinghaiensis]